MPAPDIFFLAVKIFGFSPVYLLSYVGAYVFCFLWVCFLSNSFLTGMSSLFVVKGGKMIVYDSINNQKLEII